jgi:hypothetical protein
MWTIHDYPAHGMVFGFVHQGYKACATYGLDITFQHSIELGKVVYEGSHWQIITHIEEIGIWFT